MLFNSYIFLFLFLPIAVFGYYALNYAKFYKAAMIFLIGMSLWFYGYNNVYYLIMLVVSVLMNYGIAYLLGRVERPVTRKTFLTVGVLLNLGILFYFKYFDFFIENVNRIFQADFSFLNIALPLGISFYTFQQLSYIIDCYRKECEIYSLVEYAAYVTFFPQLIAGPIVYHNELIPQFREHARKKFDFENLSKGIYAFALGLAKKVLIADTFSKVVTVGYSNVTKLNSTSALVVMVCYSLQIYYDFSGYCDMAYGIGYLFNVELPINFNSPYKADSVRDFWKRWHMTLTRFFTKYIYIPLGGNRKGTLRTYLNTMIVFLVSGLWHGANWTFILWGGLNGLGNVFDRMVGKYIKKFPKFLRVGTTFLLITFLWSLFRASSITEARMLWRQLLEMDWGTIQASITEVFNDLIEVNALYVLGLGNLISLYPGIILWVFIILVLLASFFLPNTQEKVKNMKLSSKEIAVIVIMMTWSIISLSDVSEFLYFNF